MTICKYYNKCYFPRDIAKGMHENEGVEKYLNSCHFYGMDCELSRLESSVFKIFEKMEVKE